MAVRHVNVVERLFGLSNRSAAGDAEALAELLLAYHQNALLEGYSAEALNGQGETVIRAYFDTVTASYDEWQCVLDYAQDYGDRVLALGALRSVQDGVEKEQALGWIFTFRDDKIDAVKAYPSYGDALRAATARSSSDAAR